MLYRVSHIKGNKSNVRVDDHVVLKVSAIDSASAFTRQTTMQPFWPMVHGLKGLHRAKSESRKVGGGRVGTGINTE